MSAPIIAVVALAVRMLLGKPVLFRDSRIGHLGKQFDLLKFRSMTDGRDSAGEPLPDRERLTGFGRFLRRWSLDELPELVNVIKGDMSLIGPRPLPARYAERFNERQMMRHRSVPGLTGWAQVNGRNAVTWAQRFEMDEWYLQNQSFLLDMKILGLTVLRVAQGQGISADGHVTMPEFMGDEE